MTQLILKDSTATLVSYPPRPSRTQVTAPTTVKVWTRGKALPATGDNVTVPTIAVATDALAEEGTKQLSFASDPGFPEGRRVVVDHPSLEPFHVEIVSSDTTTYLKTPLPCDVPLGATIKDVAITHALTAIETQLVGHGVAHVTATHGAETLEWEDAFFVVPRCFANRLTVPELWSFAPEFARTRPDDDDTGQGVIDAEYLRLFAQLEKRGYEIDKIRTADPLKLPVVEGIRYQRALALKGAASEHTMEQRKIWLEEISTADGRSRFWYAADAGDNDPGTIPEVPVRTRIQKQIKLER